MIPLAPPGNYPAEDNIPGLRSRIAELERIISKAGDALTTPYANDEERIENARRILEQR